MLTLFVRSDRTGERDICKRGTIASSKASHKRAAAARLGGTGLVTTSSLIPVALLHGTAPWCIQYLGAEPRRIAAQAHMQASSLFRTEKGGKYCRGNVAHMAQRKLEVQVCCMRPTYYSGGHWLRIVGHFEVGSGLGRRIFPLA